MYQVDGEAILPLFIKTLKSIFRYDVSRYNKNSACEISFNFSKVPVLVLYYRNVWNEVELQIFQKLKTESIKGEDKYMLGKLKTWKEHIKTNFHGQDVVKKY